MKQYLVTDTAYLERMSLYKISRLQVEVFRFVSPCSVVVGH